MPSNPKKRPIGLKAQSKLGQPSEAKKAKTGRDSEGDGSFTAVALVGPSAGSDEDGLTIEDLVQMKNQAGELIDNPTGTEEEAEQLVNLLRGICHEAFRLVRVAAGDGADPVPRRLHQLVAWAFLELAVFLQFDARAARNTRPDEPTSIEAWMAIAARTLDRMPAFQPEQAAQGDIELELVPHSIAILKAQRTDELLEALGMLLKQGASDQTECGTTYLVRTIDRLVLVKAKLIAEDPTPIFEPVVEFLRKTRGQGSAQETVGGEEQAEDIREFQRLIDQRLADCYLTHGSLLADQLEYKYYHQDQDDDDDDDQPEDFVIDVESPAYKLSLENLRLAEQTFSTLLVDMDDSDELKVLLKTKLDEALLTIGNLLPPGPEREEMYLRAGLGADDDTQPTTSQ